MNDPRHFAELSVGTREVLDWIDAVERRYRDHGPEEAIAMLREFRDSLGRRGPVGTRPDVASCQASWLRRVEAILSRELPVDGNSSETSAEVNERESEQV
jgi:hypothetical protein